MIRPTLAAAALLGAVVAANTLTTRYGFVPVGFGLEATAGTYAAGAALAARDALQDVAGKRATVLVLLVAAVVSYLISDPFIAAASAVAFLLAELVDLAVYTPLRRRASLGDRRWTLAVVLSNLAGAVVDSVVFLGVAFGAPAVLPALAGQLLGKSYATAAYLLGGRALAARRRRW